MKGLSIILLLVSVPELTQSFPVTASQGGNSTLKLFFCKDPGCAADAKKVFCNDELVTDQIHMVDCDGPPAPNTVCHWGGRVFISAEGVCEFEARAGQIQTETCADDSRVCEFPTAITSASVATDGDAKARYLGVVCAMTALILKL